MDAPKADIFQLRVFDTQLEEGSLIRAGFRLCLSEPAMSHALAKLRTLTGDALFVRVPAGTSPALPSAR